MFPSSFFLCGPLALPTFCSQASLPPAHITLSFSVLICGSFVLHHVFYVCSQCPHELPCPQLTASKPLACSFSQAYHPIPFNWVCTLGILQQGKNSLGKQDEKESETGGARKIQRVTWRF